ncbi:hypothetical protein [Nocardioides sp. SYSU D00038]|uniref:hypothetical protein n=1 Tax=Nocardioides sp. SYSU D00038 TaxID=2812554 RepID=UPI0019675F55|nr:hypothetical protein [Nocardioides sp. SYSU D00038]
MGDYGADVPLWHNGLMFTGPDELVEHLGVSRGLAEDLTAWGRVWEERDGQPSYGAEAQRLVQRLATELEHLGYRFVYVP